MQKVVRSHLVPTNNREHSIDPKPEFPPETSIEHGDLFYSVELWNDAETKKELLLAATSTLRLGIAAYEAAVREYPGRCIRLRRENRTILPTLPLLP